MQDNSLWQRVRTRLFPGWKGVPADDRGRMRMVLDSLVLHVHPAKVPASTLRWTYTWGLGGLSALLLMVLMVTGVMLLNNYTPAVPQAYLDILALRASVWFGEFLRNLHHWSANLLIVIAGLHLLRVFATGAYRPPRELNWLIGLAMFLLILGSNFTGYLLPWDQLAYWAVTVGTSILSYIPLVGEGISRMLLGGAEVGSRTLLNFYSLHIAILPLIIFGLMMFHFWRVRKDGGLTRPKAAGEAASARVERVTTIPHLVQRELVYALGWLAALFVFSMLVPAPLEGIANPDVSPNPAKAPWYFLGLQELLLHFHPLVAAVILPGLALLGLFLLPFVDVEGENVGVYFRSARGRGMALLAIGLGLLLTPAWVLLDEYVLHWAEWLPGWHSLLSNGVVPLSLVGLVLFFLDDVVHIHFRASREERILFMFMFLATAFFVLTVIGIFFRGPGMALYWPWEMPVAH